MKTDPQLPKIATIALTLRPLQRKIRTLLAKGEGASVEDVQQLALMVAWVSCDVGEAAAEWVLTTDWIPVTERMPDTEAMPLDKQYVLVCEVYAKETPIEVARYIESRWLAVDSFMLQCVTHWQPLPELPNESPTEEKDTND